MTVQDRRRGSHEERAGPTRCPLVVLVALSCLLPMVAVAQPVPPDAAYRTFDTEHFRITYPQDLESLAPFAAEYAERAHAALTESFLPPPSSTIDLVLTDHADASNGVARIFPSPRMVIWAQPPVQGLALSHYEGWLELVILHELVHVFHLDHAGTPGTILRSVMGRVPWTWPAFPGYAAAPLGIEGVAVHRESLHTGAGRVHGGYHDAIVRTQALGGPFAEVDQGLGRSPVWPGGDRPYVFGGEFFRHLSETYGEPAVVRFLGALADQWIPYRLDAAAREAFGVDFTALWAGWVSTVEAEAARVATRIGDAAGGEPPIPTFDLEHLTDGARYGLHPAAGPDSAGVAYVRSNGRSETSLMLLTGHEERALARWNGLDPPRWMPDGTLLVPQLEYVDNYRVYRDLYRVTSAGEVTRITRGLRVLQADPHPSDGTIVAVLGDAGATRLALLSAAGGVERILRGAEPGVVWSYPAWSPDGERLAVARRGGDGRSTILVMDAVGGASTVVSEDRSLNTAPAWSADGEFLLWSSDRTGIPNLFVAHAGSGGPPFTGVRQVTDVATAVTFPSVDPSGEWIYASVLTDDGWEIARLPFDASGWVEPAPPEPRYRIGPGATDEPEPRAPNRGTGPSGREARALAERLGAEARPYSALSTVLPRYWEPVRVDRGTVFGRRVLPAAWGARTSGEDLVGRHAYAIELATSLDDPWSRTEWGGHYRWSGLGNPTFLLETGQRWDTRSPIQVDPDSPGDLGYVAPVLRERWVGGTVEMRRLRARTSTLLTLGARSIDQARRIFELNGEESVRFEPALASSRLSEARLTLGFSTARAYDFSVSLEDGATATAALRQRWDRSVPDSLIGRTGLDGAFREAVVALRGYRGVGGPGYASHVLAVRLAAGVADGPAAGTGHFAVGGGEGMFPVRGLAEGSLRGSAAWASSLEWRFPVTIVHRGLGTWPLYVDRLAGSLFYDAAGVERSLEGAGSEWRIRSAVGVEIAATVSVFFEALDRLRVGVAVPLGPAGDRGGRASFYLTTGWAF